MAQKPGIDRREFIVSTSAAAVGLAGNAAAGAPSATMAAPSLLDEQAPTAFRTPAGSVVPFSADELARVGPQRTFTGEALREIAFPLGGIGTGTVSLGGRGQLRDWEIFNRPAKGRVVPFSFVALWAREEGGNPMLRVVESALQPPFTGGDGQPRESAQGLPRLRDARFTGAYPFARIDFDDDRLPVRVSLEAFNPFVPLDVDDSSLPVAIFHYRLTSTAARPVAVALAFSLLNAVGYDGVSRLTSDRFEGFGQNQTTARTEDPGGGRAATGLEMTSGKYAADSPRHGSLAILATGSDVSTRRAWRGTEWFDSFQNWVNEFAPAGRFDEQGEVPPSPDGRSMYGSVAPRLRLAPGASATVTFVLAWHFPRRENYWNPQPEVRGALLTNDYASRFTGAWDVARFAAANLERLERRSRAFHDALFSSTLPAHVLDAVSSQASILRTNTGMLLEGRRFFGFEGCNDSTGCCPLNCTHVWNYEQTLAHLFPSLERTMRETDFTANMRPDGSMAFRTLVPLGRAQWQFKPAADGQMGSVLKLYREWQISGDTTFLRKLWPEAKRALEFAWTFWDADRDGVMEGEQHNTYDIEFYGPNPMMTALYLGALKAGAAMAEAVGDSGAAVEYRRLVESGRAKVDALWNGEFYVQRVPPPDRIVAQPLEGAETWHASSLVDGQPRYQYGEGCLSDQLLGQWFSDMSGPGELLPPERVRAALASIYRYNFRHDFFDHQNAQRIYALNDEKGLLLCSWPKGGRPALPFVYADEVWTGIEYQVAAHLIHHGLVFEGLAIVRGTRDRYDGRRRNPWNEVECGSHYARALASWSVLLALSGFRYSAPEQRLSFAPRFNADDFRTFFSAGSGWGVFSQRADAQSVTATLRADYGEVRLRRLALADRSTWTGTLTASVEASGQPAGTATVAREGGAMVVDLGAARTVAEGGELRVRAGLRA